MSATDESAVDDAAEWLCCARAGNFAGAWEASDRIRSRGMVFHDPNCPRHVQCVWNGSNLRGRRVLIRCYHGLGDTLQFIRYAPLVRELAREVIVWSQPELLTLLRSVEGIDRLLPLHDGSPDVRYDVDVEVMELPYLFRTLLDTIPRRVPYLGVSKATLGGSGFRAGLVWRAGIWDERRTLPFELLEPLFAVTDVSWFRLQKEAPAHESDPRLRPVATSSVVETASAMLDLDLVVSIDSMPAHLAGALGRRVWTLLPFDCDWRWMVGRPDSPWYPTMRLIRQPSSGDWRSVVDVVAKDVQLEAKMKLARSHHG